MLKKIVLLGILCVFAHTVDSKVTQNKPKAIKWGIVTAGNVSHDFANALTTVDADVHKIVAIGARDLGRAQKLAHKFGIPKAYGSYLELAQDPNVEVAYIGTINPFHLELAQLMLEHGKHVLCEKPFTMNEKQAQKLTTYAKQKGLFVMEALWSRFLPSIQYVRRQIQSGALGEILSIEAELGLENLQYVDINVKKALGGGTVLNTGVYPIQLCQWLFEGAPKSINATGRLNNDGVDIEMSAEIKYSDDKVCKIRSSFLTTYKNAAVIVGTKGQITIPSFWMATSVIDVDGTTKNWPLPKPQYEPIFGNSVGFRYEAEAVRQNIHAGQLENGEASHDDSLQIARIKDKIRRQIGVKYPADE